MARTTLEALTWTELGPPVDVDSLKGFLDEFPNGAHAKEAKSKLAELEHQAAAAREAEERQRRETEAWASASAAGNVAALEAFLKDWPESKHANVARSRIKEIKGVPSRRWLLQGLGAGVGLAAVSVALLGRPPRDQSIRTFTGHPDGVSSVSFSPDGRTALSGSGDKTLKLWDVAMGKEIRTFTGHSDDVSSVSFSPDGGTALSGSADETLKLWDLGGWPQVTSPRNSAVRSLHAAQLDMRFGCAALIAFRLPVLVRIRSPAFATHFPRKRPLRALRIGQDGLSAPPYKVPQVALARLSRLSEPRNSSHLRSSLNQYCSIRP